MRQNYIYFAFPFFSLQESVYERMKKSGGANSFNLFVIAEMECMHRLLAAVRETLLVSLVCSLLVSINKTILGIGTVSCLCLLLRRIAKVKNLKKKHWAIFFSPHVFLRFTTLQHFVYG